MERKATEAFTIDTGDFCSSEAKKSSAKTKAESAEPVDNEKDVTFHYSTFGLLFMLGAMAHFRKYRGPYAMYTAAHILLYIFTQAQIREAVLLSYFVLCLWSVIAKSPHNANHHFTLGVVSMLLIPQQAHRCLGTFSKTKPALNLVRWAVVIVYFMAGFHKINYDFLFEPSVSCAYHKIWRYLGFFGYYDFGGLPFWLRMLPFGVLLVEFLPPFIFVLCRDHRLALIILLKLHYILLPLGFADFGSIAMSYLWLFIHPTTAAKGRERTYFDRMGIFFVFFDAFTKFVWEQTKVPLAPFEDWNALFVMVLYGIFWIRLIRNYTPGPPLRRPRSLSAYIVLGLFVTHCMGNYLGLRTVGTLSMFSNLRTEGPTSNHLLLSSNPLKIFGFQEDVVEILGVDESFRSIRRGDLWQKVVFDKDMIKEKRHNWSDLYMKVKYQGVIYETSDLNNDPAFDIFRGSIPFWKRKYLNFRRIQQGGPQKCDW